MSNKPFSLFKQGNETYEVVDNYARSLLGVGRKYLFLGDSYSLNSGNNVTWVDRAISNLGLTSDDYVRCTASDVGLAPAFWATTLTHRSWVDAIAVIKNRITDDIANSITDIVVAGGYNETGSPNHTDAEIETPMEQFATYCKTAFPKAKLWLGFIGYNVANTATGADIRKDLNTRVWSVYSRASKYGFAVMSGVEHCLWYNDETTGDGIHPNDSISNIIGDAITNNLIGCKFDSAFGHGNIKKTMFTGSDFTGANDVAMESTFEAWLERVSNDHARLMFNPVLVFTNVAKPATKTVLTLGTIDSKLPLINDLIIANGVFAVLDTVGGTLTQYLGRIAITKAGVVQLYIDGLFSGSVIADGATVALTIPMTNMYLDHSII